MKKPAKVPRYLYHYAPKFHRTAITTEGLVSKDTYHGIHLCSNIYDWRHRYKFPDLWRVDTSLLDPERFTVCSPNSIIDYYGRDANGIIRIPPTALTKLDFPL